MKGGAGTLIADDRDAASMNDVNEHQRSTAARFGARADAYVTSAVHAHGDDLLALARLVAGAETARVLDLGCGGGHVAFTVAPHVANVVAYDLSTEMLAAVTRTAHERGLRNISAICGPAERLPFPDAWFDFVFSRFSAHHWSDVPAGLAEARRVLRAGGRAAFVDVVAPEAVQPDTFLQAIELLRDPTHVRDYGHAQWRSMLEAAGFAPGDATLRRLRIDFATWIERMHTPPQHVVCIRALQQHMPRDVAELFAVEADGSFTIDVLMLEAN